MDWRQNADIKDDFKISGRTAGRMRKDYRERCFLEARSKSGVWTMSNLKCPSDLSGDGEQADGYIQCLKSED